MVFGTTGYLPVGQLRMSLLPQVYTVPSTSILLHLSKTLLLINLFGNIIPIYSSTDSMQVVNVNFSYILVPIQ